MGVGFPSICHGTGGGAIAAKYPEPSTFVEALFVVLVEHREAVEENIERRRDANASLRLRRAQAPLELVWVGGVHLQSRLDHGVIAQPLGAATHPKSKTLKPLRPGRPVSEAEVLLALTDVKVRSRCIPRLARSAGASCRRLQNR